MNHQWIVVLLLLGACGQRAEQAPKGGATVDPTPAGGAATSVAAAIDLVPAYPGATPVEVPNLGVAGTDSRSGNATATETGDSPLQVAQFYRDRFAASNMPIRADSVTATGGIMSIGRDGGQGAMLTITRPAGRTRITVIQRR